MVKLYTLGYQVEKVCCRDNATRRAPRVRLDNPLFSRGVKLNGLVATGSEELRNCIDLISGGWKSSKDLCAVRHDGRSRAWIGIVILLS